MPRPITKSGISRATEWFVERCNAVSALQGNVSQGVRPGVDGNSIRVVFEVQPGNLLESFDYRNFTSATILYRVFGGPGRGESVSDLWDLEEELLKSLLYVYIDADDTDIHPENSRLSSDGIGPASYGEYSEQWNTFYVQRFVKIEFN